MHGCDHVLATLEFGQNFTMIRGILLENKNFIVTYSHGVPFVLFFPGYQTLVSILEYNHQAVKLCLAVGIILLKFLVSLFRPVFQRYLYTTIVVAVATLVLASQ